MTTQELAFLDAIEKEPHNQAHKLIFADWLEEQDRHGDGDAMRWLAVNRRNPLYVFINFSKWWIWVIEWPILNPLGIYWYDGCYLPLELYNHMDRNKEYVTFQDAIESFFIA